MKKVGKTTTLFRYNLNQPPCDYTVEVTNRFKGLDLIDRVPEKLWMEVCDIVWKTSPAGCWLLLLSRFSHVRFCTTPETTAHQAPPSLGFSRQEHWSKTRS